MKFTPGTVCLMSVLLILSGCANQETGSVSESIQENNERIGTNAESTTRSQKSTASMMPAPC